MLRRDFRFCLRQNLNLARTGPSPLNDRLTVFDFQNTKFKLAEMVSEIEAMRPFVDQCIKLHVTDEVSPELAAKAKLRTTELADRVLDECVQLHGGYGYMWEYPVGRAWADARVHRIYAGTNEVMKHIISRGL